VRSEVSVVYHLQRFVRPTFVQESCAQGKADHLLRRGGVQAFRDGQVTLTRLSEQLESVLEALDGGIALDIGG
jgi:hypothetical protein